MNIPNMLDINNSLDNTKIVQMSQFLHWTLHDSLLTSGSLTIQTKGND